MALPLDGYRILDAKKIEEKVKKIREVRKWQRLMNVTGAECSTDQKKGGLDLDGKQKSQ